MMPAAKRKGGKNLQVHWKSWVVNETQFYPISPLKASRPPYNLPLALPESSFQYH